MTNNDIRLEDLLVGDLKIFQSKSQYNFTSDACILSQFVSVGKNDKIIEACSGSGVISILLCAKGAQNITCFELQPQMADMSQKSVQLNNLQNKIKIVCDDFQNCKNHINFLADTVVCNPPYFKDGKPCQNTAKMISKFETTMSLEALVKTTSSVLKNGGNFYVCFTPERTSELLCLLSKYFLEPKQMFFSQKDSFSKPSCLFVKATKGGKSGIEVLPTLFTHDKDGKFVLTTAKMFENLKGINV